MAGGGIKINNIKVSGGADGKTPVFNVEDGYLFNSYDNGKTWHKLGKVKGNDGVDGKDGLAGAKLLSQELIGQDAQGGNIYKQTFSDGTEAYFTAPKGQDANPAEKGTSVIVGGVEQKTWNADTKLDLVKPLSTGDYFVMIDNDETGYGQVQRAGTFTPQTSYADFMPVLRGKQGQLKGQTPPLENQTDLDLINRGEFNDGLSGKVSITPDGFPATYAGLFGKDGSGNIEIVTKTLYWDGVEDISNFNNNGSVAGYSHRATGENVLYTGTPDMPYQAANKKYVDTVSDGKLDKVTQAYKVYGTDENGNQNAYQTGWSATSSLFQLMDFTPNGGYTDDGNFKDSVTGTYMVGIPKKASHATPKKWVEDNFTVYKHLIQLYRGEGSPTHIFNVLSTRSTPYTNASASELPENEVFTILDDAGEQVQFVRIYNFKYVNGIQYDHNTGAWEYISETISSFFTIVSDTVTKA